MRKVVVCVLFIGMLACTPEKKDTAEGPASGTSSGTTSSTAVAPAVASPCAANPRCGNYPGSACLTSINAQGANIPSDACANSESDAAVAEQVAIFAWNSFVALNWPANLGNCSANTARSILDVKSGDGTYAVWQTYMSANDVFVAPTKSPAGWCGGNRLAQGPARGIADVAKAPAKAALLGGAFAGVAEPGSDTQSSGPNAILVDQSGRWVRYEKLMNYAEYDYIVNKAKIFRNAALKDWAAQKKQITLPDGTIEIKASWKILTAAEKASGRYFTTQARVNNTPGGPIPGACDLNPVWLGLVGLHIVRKVPSSPTMIWSTFEHVDNDAVFSKAGASTPPNTRPAKPAAGPYQELSTPPECKPLLAPTQVKRLNQPSANPALNEYYQKLLGGSVFANYRLIGSAFASGGPGGNYPANVANITLETYVQNSSQPFNGATWTGCFSCHINASTLNTWPDGTPQYTNLSFFFIQAQ